MSRPLLKFIAAPLLLAGCQTPTIPGATVIDSLCVEWGRSLPTRSSKDTQRTQEEIAHAYNVFESVCNRPLP